MPGCSIQLGIHAETHLNTRLEGFRDYQEMALHSLMGLCSMQTIGHFTVIGEVT